MPINDVRIPASFWKTLFDLGYMVAALALALVVLTGAVWAAIRAGMAVGAVHPLPLLQLVVTVVAAYLIAQAIARFWPILSGRGRLSWWTGIFLVVLAYAGARLVAWASISTAPFVVWNIVAAVLALRWLLSFGRDFLVDTVGDIQIYTTHDENSRFFRYRKRIVAAVGDVLLDVLQSKDDKHQPVYDKIFLVGHSLGTTVLMDVLIDLHQLTEEEAVSASDWRRIRALITFGTALEKTRFFFDVHHPTLTASYAQWRDDVYGHLFTPTKAVLTQPVPPEAEKPIGIYWANLGYFRDVVANEIVTFKSARSPGDELTRTALRGAQVVADNTKLRSPWSLWPHSHYLHDKLFWTRVLPIVASPGP